ncbi:MAG: HEAT repeat domain-containing protein [Chloroflexota bacterium]|nr:HEAT repeat domain-containing protein [Chloroflexota bacterium]
MSLAFTKTQPYGILMMHCSQKYIYAGKARRERMGYWIYLQEAQVLIPRERQRLALATLKRLVGDFTWVTNERYCNAETFAETLQGLRWRPVQDREGNVYTLEFNGQKIGNDRAPFEALAPCVEKGGFVSIEGEDEARWTWSFDGLHVRLVDSDKDIYESSYYLASPAGVPSRRPRPFPLDSTIYEQVTQLAARLLSRDTGIREDGWRESWHRRFSRRWQAVLRQAIITLLRDHGTRGLQAVTWWLEQLSEHLATLDRDPGDVGLALALDTLSQVFRDHLPGSDQLQTYALTSARLWAERLPVALSAGSLARMAHLHLLAEPLLGFPTASMQPTVQVLLAVLHDPWYEARHNAAHALGRLGEHVPLEALSTLLQAEQWEQREVALQVLTWQSQRVPLAWLRSALEDAQDAVRAAAVTALATRAEPGITGLLEAALDDTSDTVQQAACLALGMRGGSASLERLTAIVKDAGWHENERGCAAIDALGMLGKYAPVELLIEEAQSFRSAIIVAALQALDRLGTQVAPQQIVAALRSDSDGSLLKQNRSPHTRALARRLLGKHMSLPELMEQCDTWQHPMQAIAILILGTLGPADLVEPLRRLLKGDYVHYQQWGALFALEAVGRGATPTDLVPLLNQDSQAPFAWLNDDENGFARLISEHVFWALDAWRAILPVEDLVALARNPQQGQGQGSALRLLALLDEQAPIDVLLEALSSDGPGLRRLAAEQVRKLWASVPLAEMVVRLESPDEQIRDMAIEVLAKKQYQPLIPDLLPLLKDERARYKAREALMAMAEFVPVDELLLIFAEGDRFVKGMVLNIIGRMGPRVPLPVLLTLVEELTTERSLHAGDTEPGQDGEDNDANNFLYHDLLLALGHLGERAPLAPLMAALHDPHQYVQSGALEALRIRGGTFPIDEVLPLLHAPNEYARRDAAKVLEASNDPAAIEPLFELLADHVLEVREAAIKALQHMRQHISQERILSSLESRSSSVRAAALELLEHRGQDLPIEPVTHALSDPSIYVRRAAARTLAVASEQAPLEPLLQALRDPSEQVRAVAVTTLAKMGERLPPQPLLAMLGDTSDYARRSALQAFFLWRPETLHAVAGEARAMMQGQGPGPLLGSLERSLKARVLGDIGQATPDTVAYLTGSLGWHYWQTRMEAAKALGRLEGAIPRRTLDLLLDLRDDHESEAVREAAQEALDLIRGL